MNGLSLRLSDTPTAKKVIPGGIRRGILSSGGSCTPGCFASPCYERDAAFSGLPGCLTSLKLCCVKWPLSAATASLLLLYPGHLTQVPLMTPDQAALRTWTHVNNSYSRTQTILSTVGGGGALRSISSWTPVCPVRESERETETERQREGDIPTHQQQHSRWQRQYRNANTKNVLSHTLLLSL